MNNERPDGKPRRSPSGASSDAVLTQFVSRHEPGRVYVDGPRFGRPARSPSLPPLDDTPSLPDAPPDAPTA